MSSNLWPVAAYAVVFLWLIMVNADNLPLGFSPSEEYYLALGQLDGTAHFTVALSLASIGRLVFGRRTSLVILATAVVVWEAFEVLTQPMLAGPTLVLDSMYLMDTLDDMVLGMAGILVGVYLNDEPSNTLKE